MHHCSYIFLSDTVIEIWSLTWPSEGAFSDTPRVSLMCFVQGSASKTAPSLMKRSDPWTLYPSPKVPSIFWHHLWGYSASWLSPDLILREGQSRREQLQDMMNAQYRVEDVEEIQEVKGGDPRTSHHPPPDPQFVTHEDLINGFKALQRNLLQTIYPRGNLF